MIDDPREADAQADEAPEARNCEQDDEDAQAQSVAEAARRDRRRKTATGTTVINGRAPLPGS